MLQWDPCGIVCVIMIYACIVYADYVVTIWLVMPLFSQSIWGAVHIVIFNTLLFMTILSHARTMLSDPGLVPISKAPRMNQITRSELLPSSSSEDSDREATMLRGKDGFVGEDWTMCTRCQSLRPPRAHHCRVCKRCVRKMDHHCPWVNNCVGEFNQKYFLQFLFYVLMCSLYAIVVLIFSWIYDDEKAPTGMKGPFGESAHHAKVLHSIFLSMESFLFGMFVIAVSCDQLGAIFSEETTIEAVQRRGRKQYKRARRRGRMALLRDVCGGGGVMSWFLPCSSIRSERDVISYPRNVSHYDV